MDYGFTNRGLPWLAMVVGFLLVIGAVWWASAATSPRPASAAPARPSPPRRTAIRAARPTWKEMFPMGNIFAQLPRRAHPYRTVAEPLPSFMRGGRLWQPTGRFAFDGQLDLVPTGAEASGRAIYALANTAAPDKVLFVRSRLDPHKFAIYR